MSRIFRGGSLDARVCCFIDIVILDVAPEWHSPVETGALPATNGGARAIVASCCRAAGIV
jgi:hypothetical protein